MSRALLSGVLLALLCACPPTSSAPCETDAECPGGRCRFGGCGPACVDDSECAGGEACVSGACVARAECTQATDCATGFTCQQGQCRCSSDRACAANQACVQGRCETRAPCTTEANCPAGQRCEPTQGLCHPPCRLPTDCAPGVDPTLAPLLFTCREGDCLRPCVGDAACGAGFVCEAGACTRAPCTTRTDCPAGQYCTSATNGRCRELRTCSSAAECGPNSDCRPFGTGSCPPGVDCNQPVCQELPRCLVDADCPTGTPAWCQQGYCQPTVACSSTSPCPSGRTCVAGRCVPGACRGPADCPTGQSCSDGACRAPPRPVEILATSLSPRSATLVVGDTLQLTLVAYALDGTGTPLASASYTVVDEGGAPSSAVSVSPSGRVEALAAGRVRVQARPSGSAVAAQEATLTVLPALDSGRRVVVVDAASRRPLAGVQVLGCNEPPASGPCPAPLEAVTDASGVALFPSSTGATATFSAASPELRADGLPRYDRVSVVATRARDVLLPLGDNPVRAAAGFNAALSFSEVGSTGEAWLGFALLSAGDITTLGVEDLLGEPFVVTVPGLQQPVPVSGSLVASLASGLVTVELKSRSYGLGQAGRRTVVGFAGKFPLERLTNLRPTELLAYTGAMDYALQPATSIPHLPRVVDTADVDGDGQRSELVPDYARFPGLSLRPRREQRLRTEVAVAPLPAGLDTAVVAAVSVADEPGVVPLGLASRTGAGTLLLQSGAPYDGVEAGTPGVWAVATSAAGTGSASGWLLRSESLPGQVTLPAWLPLPSATYSPAERTLAPAAASWAALAQAGVRLGRVSLTGAGSRHVVYFPLEAGQVAVRVPASPAGGGEDPATQAGVALEVVALRPGAGLGEAELLDSPGANLTGLARWLDAYSRSRP